MAFNVPNFNLTCNIWHNSAAVPPAGLPAVVSACQLAWDGLGQRMILPRFNSTRPVHMMALRLPVGTDVQSIEMGNANTDVAEVPAGSGRYYRVFAVDDVAKGFANEYRVAVIVPDLFPIPLP